MQPTPCGPDLQDIRPLSLATAPEALPRSDIPPQPRLHQYPMASWALSSLPTEDQAEEAGQDVAQPSHWGPYLVSHPASPARTPEDLFFL